MDEVKGRTVSFQMSFKITGTIGVLMAAYEENELTANEVRDCVEGLQNLSFAFWLCKWIIFYVGEGKDCMAEYNLKRFLDAQEKDYAAALQEIKNGKKCSHWMWYIFPQIAGLGLSSTSRYYAIANIDEAKEYMCNPVLKAHMLEICGVLLQINNKDANKIFGYPDNLKLKSSMTLFEAATPEHEVFKEVLEQYFQGRRDEKTISIIS